MMVAARTYDLLRIAGPPATQLRPPRVGLQGPDTERGAAELAACDELGRRARPDLRRPDQGPTITIFAIEGTPALLIRNSMYGPGGAKAPRAGAVALRVVAPDALTASGKMSWLWLNPWVTEDSRIKVPRLMDAELGVWIVNEFPYERRAGAEVMVGRVAGVPSAVKR